MVEGGAASGAGRRVALNGGICSAGFGFGNAGGATTTSAFGGAPAAVRRGAASAAKRSAADRVRSYPAAYTARIAAELKATSGRCFIAFDYVAIGERLDDPGALRSRMRSTEMRFH